MSTRSHALAPHTFYHVYNRGTDKRTIYTNNADYDRFCELLYLCNTSAQINVRDISRTYSSLYEFDRGAPLVSVGAYCLMPNHFHLLVTSNVDDGISRFVGKVSTAYAMYFNKKYERTGALFQGAFKSELVSDDRYLKYLFAYIHLNPVKLIQSDWKERGIINAKATYEYVSSYHYSSLRDYLAPGRAEEKILSKVAFPEYLGSAAAHQEDLLTWLSYRPV